MFYDELDIFKVARTPL